jgi:hypothetical protein
MLGGFLFIVKINPSEKFIFLTFFYLSDHQNSFAFSKWGIYAFIVDPFF